METAKLFWSGNSQAVRLPKAYRFTDDVRELRIRRRGDRIILEPIVDETWPESFWSVFGTIPDDFERPEQTTQRRDDLDL